MSQWYFVVQGKAQGPVNTETIAAAIKAGEIGPLDLVYREGETKWFPVGDYREFHQIIRESGKTKKLEQWVVLIGKASGKKDSAKKNYTQKGPYTTEQIVSEIAKGRIQYSDYAWKDGMKEWYKIATLEDFNVSRKVKMTKFKTAPIELPPLPEATDTDLLKNVVVHEKKRPEPVEEESEPEDAGGPELVQQFQKGEKIVDELEDKKKRLKAQFELRRPKKEKATVVTASRRLTPKKSMLRGWYFLIKDSLKHKWVLHTIIGGMILIVGSLILFFSSYLDQKKPIHQISQVDVKEPLVKPVKSKIDVSKVVKKKKPAKPVLAKIKPTYLKLKTSGLKGKSPKVSILTDGSTHYKVQVKITAKAGHILRWSSYYKVMSLWSKESRKINLSRLNLPAGAYYLEAEIQDIKRSIRFFVGTKNKKFKTDLWRHKKFIAYKHHGERHRLIKISTRLDAHINELVKKARALSRQPKLWRSFFAQWNKKFRRITTIELKTVGPKSAFKYVHPELWIRLRQKRKEFKLASQSFNASKDKKIKNLTSLQRDISALKLESIKASLW